MGKKKDLNCPTTVVLGRLKLIMLYTTLTASLPNFEFPSSIQGGQLKKDL